MAGKLDNGEPREAASRLFARKDFAVPWVVFLAAVFTFVAWPIRNFLLVCWVYGSDAYFRGGIRVLSGKPIRFSNGELAPTLPDIVTAFGMFLVTAFGLTLLLIFAVRFWERHFRK
jgi:hypothetical protein